MSQIKLLADRRFNALFWTQLLGAFNDNLLKNAMVILIAFKTSSVLGIPSSQMVALSGAIFILPFFLFSATAGQLADKHEKTSIIRIIKLLEIAIMALATVGFVFQQFPLLLGTLFLMGLHSTYFGPVKYSILPQLLGQQELVGGNALVESGTFLAILIGTITGGMVVTLEPRGPAIISGILLIIAIAGYLTSRRIPRTPAQEPGIQVQWNPIPPTWAIWQITKKNRTVYLSVLGISWFWFFGTAFLSLFPPYCKKVLHSNETLVTVFLAIFSIGIGLGSLLCETLSRRRLEIGLVPFGSIGMTLFALDLYVVGSPFSGPTTFAQFIASGSGLRIAADLFLVSVFGGLFIVPLYTLIQERTDPSYRSRTIAGNNILNAFFMVVGSGLILAMMRAGLSIPQMFGVVAVLNAVTAIYIYTIVPEFLLRFLSWILANVMYRLKVEGEEQIPATGPALLVCNHVSFADWLIISAGVKRPVRFVMDHNYAKGFVGYVLTRRAKVIPIASAKEDPSKLQQAFQKVAEELRAGNLVCIFPEGRLSKDGTIGIFKPGVEKILAETPVKVVPLALEGLWGSFFSREGGRAIAKRPRRFWSRIGLRVGEPVAAAEASAEKLQVIVTALRRKP